MRPKTEFSPAVTDIPNEQASLLVERLGMLVPPHADWPGPSCRELPAEIRCQAAQLIKDLREGNAFDAREWYGPSVLETVVGAVVYELIALIRFAWILTVWLNARSPSHEFSTSRLEASMGRAMGFPHFSLPESRRKLLFDLVDLIDVNQSLETQLANFPLGIGDPPLKAGETKVIRELLALHDAQLDYRFKKLGVPCQPPSIYLGIVDPNVPSRNNYLAVNDIISNSPEALVCSESRYACDDLKELPGIVRVSAIFFIMNTEFSYGGFVDHDSAGKPREQLKNAFRRWLEGTLTAYPVADWVQTVALFSSLHTIEYITAKSLEGQIRNWRLEEALAVQFGLFQVNSLAILSKHLMLVEALDHWLDSLDHPWLTGLPGHVRLIAALSAAARDTTFDDEGPWKLGMQFHVTLGVTALIAGLPLAESSIAVIRQRARIFHVWLLESYQEMMAAIGDYLGSGLFQVVPGRAVRPLLGPAHNRFPGVVAGEGEGRLVSVMQEAGAIRAMAFRKPYFGTPEGRAEAFLSARIESIADRLSRRIMDHIGVRVQEPEADSPGYSWWAMQELVHSLNGMCTNLEV